MAATSPRVSDERDPGDRLDPDEGQPISCGFVETQVRADLDALVTVHPMGESLAAMSINLARTLDEGAGLAVAAVNRELRANLVELARMEEGEDDLGDDLSHPSSGLPSPVRNPPES